jgi:hypothetical protein
MGRLLLPGRVGAGCPTGRQLHLLPPVVSTCGLPLGFMCQACVHGVVCQCFLRLLRRHGSVFVSGFLRLRCLLAFVAFNGLGMHAALVALLTSNCQHSQWPGHIWPCNCCIYGIFLALCAFLQPFVVASSPVTGWQTLSARQGLPRGGGEAA